MNIDQIQALKEERVKEMKPEILNIKDHTVYLVDLGDYFAYSALVFKNGNHMYHCNDYELHHNGKSRKWLRHWYLETMVNKLFTETEIVSPLRNYDEYQKREEYLRNYYGQSIHYVSIWHRDDQEAEYQDLKINGTYDPVGFFYTADKDFVLRHIDLWMQLQERVKEMKDSPEYWKEAFKREMYNHEYAINWQADYDTLSAFGNVRYREDGDLTQYFNDLDFNDIQRQAYIAARREYMANADY